MEAWMSGLNQRFTKPSNLNRFREFESHRLRRVVIARGAIQNNKKERISALFVLFKTYLKFKLPH